MTTAFAVSWDYRCPFARNAHEAVVAGLRAGKDWDVTFTPFSLDQVHVEEGEQPVWDREPDARGTGVLALCWAIAVRDSFPDHFLDWHIAACVVRKLFPTLLPPVSSETLPSWANRAISASGTRSLWNSSSLTNKFSSSACTAKPS